MKFLPQNMVEKNKNVGKNSIPILFSLQMRVSFFHSIFLIFENDHLTEQTYFSNDSEVFDIEGYGYSEYYQFSEPYPNV
jgi:hypothetical protein